MKDLPSVAEKKNSDADSHPSQNFSVQTPGVKCVFDQTGVFIAVDEGCENLWGYQPEELLGRAYMDLVTEEDRALTMDVAIQIMNGAVLDNFENYYLCKYGNRKRILWQAQWNTEEKSMYCTAYESNSIQAQIRADVTAQRLYRAYRLAQIGWWEWQHTDHCFLVSDEVYLILGINKSDYPTVSPSQFVSVVHPADRELVWNQMLDIATVTYKQFEHRIIKSSGEVAHLIHYIQTERDAFTGHLKVHGTIKNITERKKAAIELQQKERQAQHYADQLSDILESMDQCFYACNRQWQITYCNRKGAEHLQMEKAQIIDARIWNLFELDPGSVLGKELMHAMESRKASTIEWLCDKRGWFEIAISAGKNGLLIYVKNIDERKEKERELHVSHERYELARKATSDIMWDMDVAQGFIEMAPTFNEIFGYHYDTRQNMMTNWVNAVHPDDIGRIQEGIDRVMLHADIFSWGHEYRLRRADGSYAYVNDRAIIIRDEQGQAVRLIGALRDITKEKEADLKLAANERRYRAMVASSKDLIALFDHDFRLKYISPNHESVFNLEELDFAKFDTMTHIHPEDADMIRTMCYQVLEKGKVELPLYRYRNKHEEYRWYESVLINKLDDPDIEAIICNTRDVTEKKAALAQVELLSMVAQETMDAIIMMDKDGLVSWSNRAFTKMIQQPLDKIMGRCPMDILPALMPVDQDFIHHCIARKSIFRREVRYTHHNRIGWLEMKGQPMMNTEGKLIHYLFMVGEITERKNAEDKLRISGEQYKLLFNSSTIAKFIVRDKTYEFAEVNDAALELYGYSREEFMNMNLMQIRPPSEVPLLMKRLQQFHDGQSHTFVGESIHQKKDGTLINVEVSSQPIILTEGLHYIIVANDITERMRLQEVLLEEKLRAQRERAKAIIQTQEKERSEIGKELHDNVNQLLTTAKLCVENVNYYPEQSGVFIQKGADLIQKSINEIRFLSKALVTPVINDIGFVDTLTELISSYEELHPFDIVHVFQFDEKKIDKGVRLTVYRIMQELFNNAIKYAKASEVSIHLTETQDRLELVFADNGLGFDLQERKAGLGLNNIRNRTEVYRGALQIDTAPGAGCRVAVSFPLG